MYHPDHITLYVQYIPGTCSEVVASETGYDDTDGGGAIMTRRLP